MKDVFKFFATNFMQLNYSYANINAILEKNFVFIKRKD